MADKIYLPINKAKTVNTQGVVRIEADALAKVSDLSVKSGLSIKKIVSLIINQAVDNGWIEFKE